MSVRVLVADDHAPTRAGVRLALERDGFEICAEAGDGPAAVQLAEQERPDLCLLDVHMPGGGIEAARRIAALSPSPAIVMLTVSRHDDDLFEALRAGASGYLLKDVPSSGLAAALRDVLAGEAALSRPLLSRMVAEFRARGGRRRPVLPDGRGADLTEREWEVLELLHDGLSTREIAAKLVLAPVTVRSHAAAIVRKLRVGDRAEAAALLGGR